MGKSNSSGQAGSWRDLQRDRQYFERQCGRPDRSAPVAASAPRLTEEMGWTQRAKIIRDMRALVQTTWQDRNRSDAAGDAWRITADQYRAVLEFAFKSDFLVSVRALRNRQPCDIEPLLQFLEAEPYFYGSGYMAEDVLRWLKRITFSEHDADRIRALILRSVRRVGWSPRTFAYYARLAPRVDSAEFRNDLSEAGDSADPRIAERMRYLLHCLCSAGKP